MPAFVMLIHIKTQKSWTNSVNYEPFLENGIEQIVVLLPCNYEYKYIKERLKCLCSLINCYIIPINGIYMK